MSRVRPLRAAGLGAVLGLALAYPVAQDYTSSGSGVAVRVIPGPAGASPPGPSSGSASAGAGGAAPVPSVLTGTGPVEHTRYGPVQVRVTVVVTGPSDRIRRVTAVQLPSGGESGQISGFAGPQLAREAITAQSANVDTVSGASYTSDGYRRSLQAALDAIRAAERKAAQ